jgi:hypothetical protein
MEVDNKTEESKALQLIKKTCRELILDQKMFWEEANPFKTNNNTLGLEQRRCPISNDRLYKKKEAEIGTKFLTLIDKIMTILLLMKL